MSQVLFAQVLFANLYVCDFVDVVCGTTLLDKISFTVQPGKYVVSTFHAKVDTVF